jgi:uncharacterized protein YrzB (UPF0473 family)
MSDEMEGTQAEILTLVDDDGEEHEFELADTAEFEGKDYVALIPVPDDAEELLQDSADLIILKVIEEDGDEVLEAIEDDQEYDRVGAFFMERLKDTFDFEEE